MRRKSIRRIPKGDYCYRIIGHSTDSKGMPIHHTRVCPYFTRKRDPEYRERSAFCKYVHIFDYLLDDCCKICGIKTGDEEFELVIQEVKEIFRNDNKNSK